MPAIVSPADRRRGFNWRDLRSSLLATLSLGLALGASLASSVAASEGNVLAAAALALLALLLALGISLTVVPRLFRRARRERLWFSLKVTSEGWLYLAVLLVIAFAAFNTGNNLIFVILSAALALLAVSETLSHLNLNGLSLKVDLPEAVPAAQTFLSGLRLDNLKVWFPLFSLSLEGSICRSGSGETLLSTRMPLAYVPFLGAGERSLQAISLRLPRRGLHRFAGFEISTRFPFGFANKRRKVAYPVEIIALPEVEPPNEFFEMLPLLNGAFESFYRGWGSDLHSIREYSPQDSARFLDWKASAKAGLLLVREFTKEDDRKCCLVFDNGIPGYLESDEPAFEKAVRVCANTARHFHELGCEIRLLTAGGSTPYSKSGEGLLEILKILALIQPAAPGSLEMANLVEERSFKILFTGSRRGAVPTALWNSAHVVFFREWSSQPNGKIIQ